MAAPGKAEFEMIIRSMKDRMDRWGVNIELSTTLTAEMVKDKNPHSLVVASGASPIQIDVPGADKFHVLNAWDVLSEKAFQIGKKVVIVGGSATGCETAHYIAALGATDPSIFTFLMYHNAEEPQMALNLLHQSGKEITVIDELPKLAVNVGRTSRWSLMKSLKLMGVALRPKTRLVEIRDDSVIVETEKGMDAIPADTVVMAVGARSLDNLAKELEGDGIQVITIGDAKRVRRLTEAVREGFEEALKI
jgi:2,4-dienoyl-CoA reductase (NADPH2)